MGRWRLVGGLVGVTGCAIGSFGCSETQSAPSEDLGSSAQAITGTNLKSWTTGDAPWGGVGRVKIKFDQCVLQCPDGWPPSDVGCADNVPAVSICTPQTASCSGTLIARDLVLTAGHCVCDVSPTGLTFQTPTQSSAVDAIPMPNGKWANVHVDDCGGTYEDDASSDLAVFRLPDNVPEADVAAPLLKPYLADDAMEFFANDYDQPSLAGYGQDGVNYGPPLMIGTYKAEVGIDETNWFAGGRSTDNKWLWMPSGDSANDANSQSGDSGGPLAIRRLSENRWYVIGTLKGSNTGGPAQLDRDVYSPTWNNGPDDMNGNWLAQFLDDADEDQVRDPLDNCGPADPLLTKCFGKPQECANPTQVDSDGDGVGDACDNCVDDPNPGQANFDGDGFGDACDGCPEHPDGRHGDTDADGVWDACDNCEARSGYVACTSDAQCAGGFCRDSGLCSRQIDDADGDGIGGICDTCAGVNSPEFLVNSNHRAERRESASERQDICDPVPLYVAEPIELEVELGILPAPTAPEHNAANTVAFEASARIGFDVAPDGSASPDQLPRKTYAGRTGFRFCSCIDADGTTMSDSVCFLRNCSEQPGQYGVDEANTTWKHLSIATASLNGGWPNADLPRGAELDRTFTSDITSVYMFGSGLGAREQLLWRFWNDLTQTGTGGSVPSRVVDGVRQVAGQLWTHTLDVGFASASSRDGDFGKKLRDTYQALGAPHYKAVKPDLDLPEQLCQGSGCNPWIDRRSWFGLPVDERRLPRWLGDLSRVYPGRDGRIFVSIRDKYRDITSELPGSVRDLFGQSGVRWASPVESTLDRVNGKVPSLVVAVESPWTGTVPIRELIAKADGGIDVAPLSAVSGPIPGPRVGAHAVFSALEHSVFLVGGNRVTASGQQTPTNEVWRYDLGTTTWRRLGIAGVVPGSALEDVAAASYDTARRQLFVLGRVTTQTGMTSVNALQLTSIDTRTQRARILTTTPALVSSERVSLTATRDHTLAMAVQRDTSHVDLFELDTAASRPAWVGYASLDGRLESDVFAADDLHVPVIWGGSRAVRRVSKTTLRQMTGRSSVADRDRDGIPDVLDDCPDAFTAAGEACPASEKAVLFAGQKLTLADRVELVTAGTLAVSGGTSTTTVGADAKIGSLRSRAPVQLRDRARASGSITSGGAVTLGNGAGATGGIKPNVTVEASTLASFSVAFPAVGADVSLEPDRRLTLSPGSYGAMSVKAGSVLTLLPGTYYFTSLTLEPQATLLVDTKTKATRVHVKSGLTFRGRILEQSATPSKLLLLYFGTNTAPVEASFSGNIVAPNAKVVLSSTSHFGAFFAKELEVQAGARINYRPSPYPWQP